MAVLENDVVPKRGISEDAFQQAAQRLGCAVAAVKAVAAVESNGDGFQADGRPRILFERHIFHRLTKGQFSKQHPKISNATPGGYIGGPAEYDRLREAATLDQSHALQSASWGTFQIMGFNHKAAGFNTVEQMVESYKVSADNHLDSFVTYLLNNRLNIPLRDKNWAAFAKVYNGPNYRKYEYDAKLAKAFARFSAQASKGDLSVKNLQSALIKLGYNAGSVDGVMGPRTRAAIRAYQEQRKLPVVDITFIPIERIIQEANHA